MRVGGVDVELGFESLDTGFEPVDVGLLVFDDSGLTLAGQACRC